MGKDLPHAIRGNGADVPGDRPESDFVEGVSPGMRAVEAVMRELAHSAVPVLLLSERGAGKHSIARRIHEMSQRRNEPFRPLACSSLKADELNLSATNGNGLLSRGTVFLEEFSDLNLDCQGRLLEALPKAGDLSFGADGSVAHGGGNGVRLSAVRLICGSARDLEVEVKAGRLREDLYYRMSGVCLRLPPLRQRKEDIPLLIDYFLHRYAREFHCPVPSLSAETQQLFQDYAWPGNVRELEDAAKALAALGDESVAMGGLRALLRRPAAIGNGNGQRVSLKEAARAASREAERELILKALTHTRWNRRRAAQELQISYKALLYKLKQIGRAGFGAS